LQDRGDVAGEISRVGSCRQIAFGDARSSVAQIFFARGRRNINSCLMDSAASPQLSAPAPQDIPADRSGSVTASAAYNEGVRHAARGRLFQPDLHVTPGPVDISIQRLRNSSSLLPNAE